MYLGFTQKKSKKNRTKREYRGGVKEQRCPNGTRRNKKTGICEPISVEPTATGPIPDAVITDTITNPGQVMEEEKVADTNSQIPTIEPQPEFGEPAQEDTHAQPPITKTIKKPNNKTVKKLKIIEQPEAPSSFKKIEFIDEPTPTIEPVEITDLLTKGESPIVDIDTGASHFNKKSNTYLS
jgi:hypothetical protein